MRRATLQTQLAYPGSYTLYGQNKTKCRSMAVRDSWRESSVAKHSMHRFILRPTNISARQITTPRLVRIMSSDSSYANLPDNVRELVSGTQISESHSESSEAEKKEVASWIAKASDSSFAAQSTIPVRRFLSEIDNASTQQRT